MTITQISVCRLSDLKDAQPTQFVVAGHDLLLILVRKAVYCVEDRCSHMSKPLAGGRLIGYQLVCPFHSAQFDVRNGKSAGFPAARPIRTFAVHVEHESVQVELDITVP